MTVNGKMREVEVRNNFELIKAMNTVVMGMNDEDAIVQWFYVWPDGADDDEIMEMAGDEEMVDTRLGVER